MNRAKRKRGLPRGRPFEKGRTRTGGRKKGTPNKLTVLARTAGTDRRGLIEWWREVCQSSEYRRNLLTRMMMGDAASMETFLNSHVYGKPAETIRTPELADRRPDIDLTKLSTEQLIQWKALHKLAEITNAASEPVAPQHHRGL